MRSAAAEGAGLRDIVMPVSVTRYALTGNVANTGGGLWFSYYCYPILTDCVINSNAANYTGSSGTGSGGGVLCEDYSLVTLRGCDLSGNTAAWGGGINAVQATMTNCTVIGNTATGTSPSPAGG